MVLIGSLVVVEEMDLLAVVEEVEDLRVLHMLALELVLLVELQVVLDLLIPEVVVAAIAKPVDLRVVLVSSSSHIPPDKYLKT